MGGWGSAASHLLPFSQHVGLCVCEDSSCILRSRSRGKHLPLSPCSPSSELLLPSSNINGCWFFNEEVGVPVQRVRRGLARGGEALRRRGKEKRCTGAKHIPRLRSSNASLAGWDSERRGREGERGWGWGGTHSKYCHALRQPSKRQTSQLQHSASHATH